MHSRTLVATGSLFYGSDHSSHSGSDHFLTHAQSSPRAGSFCTWMVRSGHRARSRFLHCHVSRFSAFVPGSFIFWFAFTSRFTFSGSVCLCTRSDGHSFPLIIRVFVRFVPRCLVLRSLCRLRSSLHTWSRTRSTSARGSFSHVLRSARISRLRSHSQFTHRIGFFLAFTVWFTGSLLRLLVARGSAPRALALFTHLRLWFAPGSRFSFTMVALAFFAGSLDGSHIILRFRFHAILA